MASSNTPDVQPKHAANARGVDVRTVENVRLIWLDADIDKSNADYRNNITHLRSVMNTINIITDGDECIQLLKQVQDEKVSIVISGALSKDIVPYIHDMSQVDSIYIFSGNKQHYEQCVKDWPKVTGVFVDIKLLCDALKQSAKVCEQNAIDLKLVATGGDSANMNLDRIDPMFMYTQIIKEILLDIQFEQQHILNFTKYCRELSVGNKAQLNKVQTFECDYHTKTPIWWYTGGSFVCPMLNQALRLSDIDVIVRMGFFIRDLHGQIEGLYQQQFSGSDGDEPFVVFRGQRMSQDEFARIAKTKGGLIAFNSFLSTSRIEAVSTRFAESDSSNAELVGVLFEMKIHPKQSTTPFASVAAVGASVDKAEEILFAMHTVFRISDIQPMNGNRRLFRVKLELTSDNDQDLQVLTKLIREETYPNEQGWRRLGLVLQKLGKPKQAEEIYRILLQQESDESQMASLYGRLGLCKRDEGEYEEAILLYEKSIVIDEKYYPNSPGLAMSYNNIGSVYDNMGEYAKALSSHGQALAIQQQSLPPTHPDLAASYSNIGLVYSNIGDYAKALSYCEQALAIQQQSLPANHPSLATSYSNIGSVYHNMGEYPKALSSHEQALAIQQQSLPSTHPSLATSYSNIGLVYSNIGDYAKALSYYEQALAIQQQSLPANHPSLATSYSNIGSVYHNMGEYPKALSSHEQAVAIQQQSLPPTHPDLAASYSNIGLVYSNIGEYHKALSYDKKALAIQQQSLPPTHPDLAASYSNIGLVYSNIGEYHKALSSDEKALAVQQQSLPSDHSDITQYSKAQVSDKKVSEILEVANCSAGIGQICNKLEAHSKALLHFENMLSTCEKYLPKNHQLLISSHLYMATTLKKLDRREETVKHVSEGLLGLSKIATIHGSKMGTNHSALSELLSSSATEEEKLQIKKQQWTYSVVLVVSSIQGSRLYSVFNELTDGHVMSPISPSECQPQLQLNNRVKKIVLDFFSVPEEEQKKMIDLFSSNNQIKSIYVLNNLRKDKEERSEFFNQFPKVCAVCEAEGKLALHWALDMIAECRYLGDRYVQENRKDIARVHFQRGMQLSERLGKLFLQ